MTDPDVHPHDERLSLGAYILGALDPTQRQSVDRHLAACPSCRDELAVLSAIRPLLDRLDLTEIEATTAPPLHGAVRSIARLRRRERRTLRAWQSVAAAAALVAAVTLVTSNSPPPPQGAPLALAETTPAGAGAGGVVRARSVAWGTAVALELTALPARDAYEVWVVASDGRRQVAGTWGATAAGGARVNGATSIPTSRIDRIEVTDGAGVLLMTFTPAHDTT